MNNLLTNSSLLSTGQERNGPQFRSELYAFSVEAGLFKGGLKKREASRKAYPVESGVTSKETSGLLSSEG